MLDKATSDKLNKDVQSYRLVTVATLVDRLKVNGSLARKCLKDLEERGLIKPVVTHSKMKIYSTSDPQYPAYPEVRERERWSDLNTLQQLVLSARPPSKSPSQQ
jgi:small subunit ribosomal protein S25e